VREDGRLVGGRRWKERAYEMGKGPEHGKESSNSAHVNGMNDPLFLKEAQCMCKNYPFFTTHFQTPITHIYKYKYQTQ